MCAAFRGVLFHGEAVQHLVRCAHYSAVINLAWVFLFKFVPDNVAMRSLI